MRKVLFFICLLYTLEGHTQLRVLSDGNVTIHRDLTTAIGHLTFGEYQSAWDLGGQYKRGIKVFRIGGSANYNIGIDARETAPNNGAGKNIGVRGIAGMQSGQYNFGVVGGLSGDETYGAGIFGTRTNHLGVNVGGKYAGYFDGATRVEGSLSATQLTTTSDIRLKENIISMIDKEADENTCLDNLLKMDVIEYNLIPKPTEIIDSDTASTNRNIDEDTRKMLTKRHFGLSAQELQTIYPNLVNEGQDGYLEINYIELVPVLIRSIQELNGELESMRLTLEQEAKARTAPSESHTAINNPNIHVTALYQNTPNPFSETTTIRFSLPDNAKSAYIYIFDMQGKMMKQIALSPSEESITINGYELSAGMYLYSLIVDGKEIDTKRMILSK